MSKPSNKISIDSIRDSALSMQVGGPEDGAIFKMISAGDDLHIVLDHAIFAIQLADQVDPKRTNAAVPNTKQRILSYGVKDPVVGQIYMTAYALFKATNLGRDFPEQKALALAFNFLIDVAAMMDMHSALVAAIQKTTTEISNQVHTNRSIELPAVGDAKARCDAFAQKVGHAINTMEAIAQMFYPSELTQKWIDSLTRIAAAKHGADSPLARFMSDAGGSLLFMLGIRNMIEHPKEKKQIVIQDFSLTPEMNLVPPHVEIVTPDKYPASHSLSSFMFDVTKDLVATGELFLALLCGEKVESAVGLPRVVVKIPEGRRPKQNPHQQFSYGIVLDGKVQVIG